MKTYLVSIDSDIWQFVILSNEGLSYKYIEDAITLQFEKMTIYSKIRIISSKKYKDKYHLDMPDVELHTFSIRGVDLDGHEVEFEGFVYECWNIEV